jgi:hypothetical protein
MEGRVVTFKWTGTAEDSNLQKVTQSHNTPMEAQRGEELLLIHDLGTRWG